MRLLELFAGIGGMRLAAEEACAELGIDLETTAVDTSPPAVACYEHNFGAAPPVSRRNIESMPAAAFEGFDTWTLSPPCQPFTETRGARQRDLDDARCAALKRLAALLPTLERPPRRLLLENVAGFLGSAAFALFTDALRAAGFTWRVLVLDPPAFGIPNHRLRLYLAAERSNRFGGGGDAAADEPPPPGRAPADIGAPERAPRPLREFVARVDGGGSGGAGDAAEGAAALTLSRAVLAQPWARRSLAIVNRADARTHCFTCLYGRVVHKAAGSVLYDETLALLAPDDDDAADAAGGALGAKGAATRVTVALPHPVARDEAGDAAPLPATPPPLPTSPTPPTPPPFSEVPLDLDGERLLEHAGRLRLFAPSELLTLFGFHAVRPGYQFPPTMRLRTRYKLVGQSVNVHVIAHVLRWLLRDAHDVAA